MIPSGPTPGHTPLPHRHAGGLAVAATLVLLVLGPAACGDSGAGGAAGGDVADGQISGSDTAGAGTSDTGTGTGGDRGPDAGGGGATDDPQDAAPSPDGATGSDSAGVPDADPTPDAATSPDTANAPDMGGGPVIVDPPSVDCAAIPEGPFPLVKLTGPIASEDLAFDRQGNVIGSNDTTIFKSKYTGPPVPFVPNLNFRAGLRYLPNGHLIVCNNNAGSLVRVDEEGVIHTVLTGLSYPNGLTVDMAGWVYFTEHDKNLVKRVNPFTGEWTVLTDKISNPNGISFSVDYRTLYLGGFDGDPTVWSMSIAPDGTPGKLIAFATGVGTGALDGMATDACGNVYIADYGATVIYRISPDGQDVKPIISGAGISGAYLPNMQWGSGIGGWDALKLYLPDGWNKGVFEVDIGVPGAPRPFP